MFNKPVTEVPDAMVFTPELERIRLLYALALIV
jgi:hypothetical protein